MSSDNTMQEVKLPTPSAMHRSMTLINLSINLAATAMFLLYLRPVVNFTNDQERAAWLTIAIIGLPLFGVMQYLATQRLAMVQRYLAQKVEAEPTHEERCQAFGQVMNYPWWMASFTLMVWVVFGIVDSVYMLLRYETFSVSSALVFGIGAAACGFIAQIFCFLFMKWNFEPIRFVLGAEIPDALERAGLVKRISLGKKLFLTMAGLTLLTSFFVVCLTQARSNREIERFLTGNLLNSLAWAQTEIASGMPRSDVLAEAARRYNMMGMEFLVVGEESGEVIAGDPTLLIRDELALIQEELAQAQNAELGEYSIEFRDSFGKALTAGTSQNFDSPSSFSWIVHDDGTVIVGVTRANVISSDLAGAGFYLVSVTLFFVLVGIGVAHTAAHDLSRGTQALEASLRQFAEGNLTRGAVYESEDELGEISRSMDFMSAVLRETVGEVMQAANGVETVAERIARASQDVNSVTEEQVENIEMVTGSMDRVNRQVREIANASEALNESVTESSEGTSEFQRSAEGLAESGEMVTKQVVTVSRSIEQLIDGVRQVSGNAELLLTTASETASGVDEVATALRQVDGNAVTTSALSDEVVRSSELGSEQVRRTIRGMEAIRSSTETAKTVMGELGERTGEIGKIVNVINDVTDETNLLALNAAIIAAQAGEHGRAFSVVADEIKDLADRVFTSTREIEGLIASVQEQSASAVSAIAIGAESVLEGVELSANAGSSLDVITQAARESGAHMGEIVSAVQEQSFAATHMVELMETLRSSVEDIRETTVAQNDHAESVVKGTEEMSSVAHVVNQATEGQATSTDRIIHSIEGVRSAADAINVSLEDQTAACWEAAERLNGVYEKTLSNQQSAGQMQDQVGELLQEAERLRRNVKKFRV